MFLQSFKKDVQWTVQITIIISICKVIIKVGEDKIGNIYYTFYFKLLQHKDIIISKHWEFKKTEFFGKNPFKKKYVCTMINSRYVILYLPN